MKVKEITVCLFIVERVKDFMQNKVNILISSKNEELAQRRSGVPILSGHRDSQRIPSV